MEETLGQQERGILFDLAREAITRAVRGEPEPALDESTLPQRLRRPGASFVTLRGPGDKLRGCIGSIEAHAPLAQDVQRNAVGSAMRDPRFPPVSPRELEGLRIELSILTPPQELHFSGPNDLLAKLRPGVDGVIIEKGWHRATLLPSVWESIPAPVEFMNILCRKAGLSEREWRLPGMTVYVYQAEKVEEELKDAD